MKSIFGSLLAVLIVAAILAAELVLGPTSLEKQVLRSEDPELSAAAQPNEVDLYFPSNPTTGYSWVAEIEDEEVLGYREQFFEDDGTRDWVGAGGTDWFHLYGVAPGTTSVVFRYARPWEDTDAGRTTYRITVDEQLNVLIWGVEVEE